jgi:CheY-like chemotaxis protein
MENQETISPRKKLLIVEDNPRYLTAAYKTAQERGYDADLACDLANAMELMDGHDYDGIITDMLFKPSGLYEEISDEIKFDKSGRKRTQIDRIHSENSYKDVWLEFIEGTPVEIALQKAIDCSGQTDLSDVMTEHGRIEDKIPLSYFDRRTQNNIYVDLTNMKRNVELFKRMGKMMHVYHWDDDSLLANVTQRAVMAYGFYVIKEAQKKGTPVVAITSTGHGAGSIPFLVISGLVTEEELKRHYNLMRVDTGGIDEKFLQSAMKRLHMDVTTYMSTFYPEFEKHNEHLGFGNWSDETKLTELSAYIPIVLERGIICMGKSEVEYNLAIDCLEGKIDHTRPYDLQAEH